MLSSNNKCLIILQKGLNNPWTTYWIQISMDAQDRYSTVFLSFSHWSSVQSQGGKTPASILSTSSPSHYESQDPYHYFCWFQQENLTLIYFYHIYRIDLAMWPGEVSSLASHIPGLPQGSVFGLDFILYFRLLASGLGLPVLCWWNRTSQGCGSSHSEIVIGRLWVQIPGLPENHCWALEQGT